jgi:sortase A
VPGLRRATSAASAGFVRLLPGAARTFRALGILALLFVLFVVVFGAMRHTARQERLEQAFQARVASGHAAGPNWRPLPGRAIATVSIPAIGVHEVVVQDTTPRLLEGGPGHLLGTQLPGHVGNAVILGRRVAGGAPFRNLDGLASGDEITVVTPSGVYRYEVDDVSRVAPGERDVLEQTTDARLTLITSASWFFPRDRLVVVATLDGTPLPPAPVPQLQLRPGQLGTAGDAGAIVRLIPWVVVLLVGALAWTRARRAIGSRWVRFLVATPPLAAVLYFVFANAEDLLPGTL